ncbi:MAG TPA: GNAT family N-acetyltransferase [Pyrinomonadaceae bacterium]|nr:GNAT family N-acetyltransferase [Pyrinomonadaceae bacterium]
MTPMLETGRLVFRPYEQTDRELLVALFTDPEVMKFVGTGVQTEDEARAGFARLFTHVYEPRAFDVWALFSKEDGAFVGHAELKPRRDGLARAGDFELIYVLSRESWGRGLATEIGRRLLAYGFEALRLGRIHATVDASNEASLRVLLKLGMRYEAEFEDEFGTTLIYVVEDEGSAVPGSSQE